MTPIILLFGQSNAGNLFKPLKDTVADAGSDAIVLNAAVGGAGVSKAGAPWNITTGDGVDEPGSAFTAMLEAIDTTLAENPDSYIAAAVWSQGEGDTFGGADVDYFNPAKEVFDATFEYIGAEVPTYILGVTDFLEIQKYEGVGAVQEQQVQLANAFDNVHFLDTDEIMADAGLTRDVAMWDKLHYHIDTNYIFAEEVIYQPGMQVALGLAEEDVTEEQEEDLETVVDEQQVEEQEELVENPEAIVSEEQQADEAELVETEEPVEQQDPQETEVEEEDDSEDIHYAAGAETILTVEDNSLEPAVLPALEETDEDEQETDSGDASIGGVGLGLSVLSAAMGVFILSIAGLLAVMFMSGRNKDEGATSQEAAAEPLVEDVAGISLSDVVPATEILSESMFENEDAMPVEVDTDIL